MFRVSSHSPLVPFTPPTDIPDRFAAGDTWEWTKVLPAFPVSEGWALEYAFSGPSAFVAPAVVDGDGFHITIPALNTKALPAGSYRWAAYVTLAGVRKQVENGLLAVEANLATLAPGSATESFAVRTLRVVEAALEGRLPSGLEEYQIAGKAVKHVPLPELMVLRSRLLHEVQMEKNGGQLGSLEVAFVPPR